MFNENNIIATKEGKIIVFLKFLRIYCLDGRCVNIMAKPMGIIIKPSMRVNANKIADEPHVIYEPREASLLNISSARADIQIRGKAMFSLRVKRENQTKIKDVPQMKKKNQAQKG